MAYNGSGVFNLYTPGNPTVTGTTISSTWANNTLTDIATGLSTCITKDGQTTVTANIPLGGFKLTNVGLGTASTDAATLANLQAGTGTYVATVGGTADAITLTPSPAIAAYAAGQQFSFIASGANTGAVTVNVSGLGAKAVTKNGTTALTAGDIPSATLVTIIYDGTQFQIIRNGAVGAGVNTFTGIQKWAKGADIASAGALTLGTDGNYFDVTGTTAITSIGTAGVGTWVKLHFDDALTLTHSATDLILPGGANITTAAGDEAEFVEYASGDWRCTSYVKSSGQPITQNILQVIEGTPNTTYSSITTAMPYDNSIPQSGEGGEVCTVTITPTSASSRLSIEAQFFGTSTSSGTVIALFQDATADAIAAGVLTHASDVVANGSLRFEMAAGTTSATTFKLRAGNNGGATTYVNGSSGGRLLGGVGACRIKVTEIKA